MGLEIERKFLVDKEKWETVVKPKGKAFKQGYILSEEKRTVRIRVTDNHAYLTLKGSTTGIGRSEFEYVIPVSDGNEILNTLTVSSLEKLRYEITYAEKLWEVDVFTGKNEGLIVAEIELQSEEETFDKPDWVLDEVSDDPRYYNASLSLTPYKDWDGVGF